MVRPKLAPQLDFPRPLVVQQLHACQQVKPLASQGLGSALPCVTSRTSFSYWSTKCAAHLDGACAGGMPGIWANTTTAEVLNS
jgi:hypothetical protein